MSLLITYSIVISWRMAMLIDYTDPPPFKIQPHHSPEKTRFRRTELPPIS